MFKNQYIITNFIKEKKIDNFNVYKFSDYFLYAHEEINITFSSKSKDFINIALIGFIIDPFNPQKNYQEIINDLALSIKSFEELLEKIESLSGRFVLFIKLNNEYFLLGDCFNSRQINFGYLDDNFWATSSLKLFLDFNDFKSIISVEKKKFIESKDFLNNESAWIGDQTFDERLTKLLPNHYLNISKRKIDRIPIFLTRFNDNEKNILEYSSKILTGTFNFLSNNFNLIQPITAGWDSRILLAASKAQKEKIKYYIFSDEYTDVSDVRISKNLSEKLNLDFSVQKPEKLNQNFLSKFTNENLFPRILPKTSHIQFHYEQKYPKDTINISGVGGEIMRCYYGFMHYEFYSKEMLLSFSHYKKDNHFVLNEIDKWLPNAKKYSKKFNISILDLFYWEQRMGNWGSLYQFEQDIAIEEFSPFNNRSLVLSVLSISKRKRSQPNYSFFAKLIKHLWPEVLLEPINPGTSKIKGYFLRNGLIKYFFKKYLSFFKKIIKINLLSS